MPSQPLPRRTAYATLTPVITSSLLYWHRIPQIPALQINEHVLYHPDEDSTSLLHVPLALYDQTVDSQNSSRVTQYCPQKEDALK